MTHPAPITPPSDKIPLRGSGGWLRLIFVSGNYGNGIVDGISIKPECRGLHTWDLTSGECLSTSVRDIYGIKVRLDIDEWHRIKNEHAKID